MNIYGVEALRRHRERKPAPVDHPGTLPSLLEEVPPDAPMDDDVLTVWNGERFVAWKKWLATAPIEVAEPERSAVPADASCVSADCSGVRVWLVRDGERWLMFVGNRRSGNRRKDFASPYIEHAIRTAEAWYGAPVEGWRKEEKRDGQVTNDDNNK